MKNTERMTDNEYKEKYINSTHYENCIFDSKVIENFLSDEEIEAFNNAAKSDDIFYIHDTSMAPVAKTFSTPHGETTAHYHIFDNFYSKPAWSSLVNIIQPKIEAVFGKDIKASHIHVLDSRFPYGLHNDAEQSNMVIAPNPAWTLIIPLDDYDSKTYVFNERSNFKDPWGWINNYKINPRPDYCIDRETFSKDFEPFTDYELMKYLTVESTFRWKRGSCFAADRYRYHCSDNYYNHGITSKRAIIIWTSTT